MTIFIGGYARTGTTLMQGIICSDKRAFPITKESWYLSGLINSYIQGLNTWIEHTDDYFNSLDDYFYFHQQIIHKYIEYIRSRWGDGKIVQKCPAMTILFPELFDFIQDSVFVVMVRDPRDTIASKITWGLRSTNQRQNVHNVLKEYEFRYQRIWEFREKFGHRLLFVHYEELIYNNSSVMNVLRQLTQLQLPIDPLRDRWEHKRDPRTQSSASQLDGHPISDKSIGSYTKVLTPEEILVIEDRASYLNSSFGSDIYLADSERRHQAIANIHLNAINLVIFPNFDDLEESLAELANLIDLLLQHPEREQMSLIVDINELSQDVQTNIHLVLLDVFIRFTTEHNLKQEEPILVSISSLNELEWIQLAPSISARLILKNEDPKAMKRTMQIPAFTIGLLSQIRLNKA